MRMFKIFGLLALIFGSANIYSQDDSNVSAYFQEFKNELYYFVNESDEEIIFHEIDAEVLEEFDLTLEEYQGELFYVTYEILKGKTGNILRITYLEILFMDDEEEEDYINN